MLTNESINFGKYKGKTLGYVLKDRKYCMWLKGEDWFQESHTYLYNRIIEYNPRPYFLSGSGGECKEFLSDYEFFNLKEVDEVELPLSDTEKSCYTFYLDMIEDLKSRIYARLEDEEENPYDIKAPVRWLKKFEKECGIPRIEFKEFLSAYDLINIPYIVERIKKEGGIEYKGAKSFLIAKERSLDQEKWWETLLKKKYGESLTVQYVFEKCIFDFLNIDTQTIFECKLGMKDFCEDQHRKYNIVLEKYRIIYLIGKDCVIDMERRKIFTTDPDKYEKYFIRVSKPSYLDLLIVEQEFETVKVEDLSVLFGGD